jgi:hypothetical protein
LSPVAWIAEEDVADRVDGDRGVDLEGGVVGGLGEVVLVHAVEGDVLEWPGGGGVGVLAVVDGAAGAGPVEAAGAGEGEGEVGGAAAGGRV